MNKLNINPNQIFLGKLINGDYFIGIKIHNVFRDCVAIIFTPENEQIKFEFTPLFSPLFPNLLCDVDESKVLITMNIPRNLEILIEEYEKIILQKLNHEEMIREQLIAKKLH